MNEREPVYPVRVSDDRRHFVDQHGAPVLWLGTTQWQLFRDQTLEEARQVLEGVKRNGFAFAQVMLAGVGDGTQPNVHGEKPWLNDDASTPNAAYFERVDAVIESARALNLVISFTLYHQRWRKIIAEQNGRRWARWLAERYRDVPNIVWSMTPEAKPEFVPVLREMAAGLREGDHGAHLVTFKPDPSPYSSSFLHEEPWLDFNAMQVWNRLDLIYPMVTHDYNLKPTKPVLMGEGAYEAGTEYGFDVTPLWVRRQAYCSFLAGASHTYGHNDSWRMLPTWPQALDAPGARQMGLLRRIFERIPEWWRLVPDQSVLSSGGNTLGNVLNLGARHQDGQWILAYLAAPSSVGVDLSTIRDAGKAAARWIDPRTGEAIAAGDHATAGAASFSTPAGWEDALLIIERAGN